MDPAKKLKALMIRLETKQKKVNPNANKSRTDIVIAKIEELIVKSQDDYVARRLRLSGISDASMYARLGEIEKLRDELRDPDFVINERDVVTGKNVLMEAVAGGHFHMVKMLLFEYNASPRVVALLGQSTPLHIAVEKGYRQIASMLITRGADVNAVDSRGCTPMHFAWKLSCARLLHRYPVDCCFRTRENLRPSEYYSKYCPPTEFDVDVHKYLVDREDEQDVRAFRKLTLAGERQIRERDAEMQRQRDDSDDDDFDIKVREEEAVDEKTAKRKKLMAYFKSASKTKSATPGMSSIITLGVNPQMSKSTGSMRPKTTGGSSTGGKSGLQVTKSTGSLLETASGASSVQSRKSFGGL